MDKLLHLTYQGKFSLIDTVVQKVTGKGTLRQLLGGVGRADLGPELEKDGDSIMKQPDADEVEGLRPEEESDIIEEIKKEEDREEAETGPQRGVEEEEKDGKRLVHLEIKPIDLTLSNSATYDSICHSWFIVKDKGVAINWKKPLIQKCQITSKVKIAKDPFADGAMRYAFMMED